MRRFRMVARGPQLRIFPAHALTDVLYERRDRKRVERWLEDWMQRPALRGVESIG